MADRRPLVLVTGGYREMPSGDRVPGAALPVNVEQLAAITGWASGDLIYYNAGVTKMPTSAAGRGFLAQAGTADHVSYYNSSTTVATFAYSSYMRGFAATGNALAAQQYLDLEPGVDIQAYDANTVKKNVSYTWTAHQQLKTAGATFYDAGNSGTSKAIDFANGQHQKLTLTGNVTLTATFPGAGRYTLDVYQDATGSRTITYSTGLPGSSSWIGSASTPAHNSAASSRTTITFLYDGTTVIGALGKVGAA